MTNWAEEVPVLQHWVPMRRVAASLGISRQQVHVMAQAGKFKSIHKLDDDGRPIFVVKRSELDTIAQARTQAREEKASEQNVEA